jgi:dynein heavy chain
MKEYNQKQITQIKALIAMAIKVNTKGDMMRIMVCITMDAHNRDCVKNKLVQFDIQDVQSFQWQSQLKHKFRVPPAHASFRDMDTHLRPPTGERAEVAICDAIIPYDYEYLGNGFRLVITPLTDRIYVTATQALNLAMGCAPAGPAGTGKTESVKDLSNALAKLVYVLNCSPDMDYKSLGAVWQGVSSSGAWICFDEFNRLIPEVLSVCTVQFKAVCDGIKSKASRVSIEGSEVKLNPTCGAYITMNPGYLGRSELPEGLKALFRPITVMVPDLVLICENFLMAQGFEDAQVLASKFYGLYSLLADLLSKQMHYDWGLRAVKSVLYVAGGFKRASPDMNEQALLMRALRDFNIPKIIKEDEVVFYGLLGDLFPGLDPPRSLDLDLEANVERACNETGLDPDEVFRLKVVQLEELTSIRHCTFMMGPSMCGKSSCWRTLVQARTYEPGGERVTYVHDISAKVMLTQDLYGYTSLATREWQDGVLSKIMRDLGQMDDKPKWIMLDGDLDANWIESMNSVMDDNKILTLPSNERIPLKENMKMIFEIRNLKYATPATVSRAGILYISADDGTQWRSCIKAWLKGNAKQSVQFPESYAKKLNEEQLGWLRACFDKYCFTTMRWLKIHTISIIPLEDMNRIATLLFMLDGLLTPANMETAETAEQVFCFCCVWAMGSGLTTGDDGTDYRKMFSDWWRSEFKTVKFPPRDSVFEYWLNTEEHQFDQWTKSPYFYSIEYDSSTSMNSVTVPTPETCSVTFWMSLLLDMRRGIMLCGPAGTGKTQMVKGLLGSQNPDEVVYQPINFSFYTNSDVCYANMDAPLEKKTGVTYGPPGNRRLVYFLDDVNLPEVDKYGTQRAIELCRQQIEYEHMYDMSKLSRKNVIQTQMVACMNPTAGSFLINPRLQRWFATFAIGLPGPVSLMTIYQTFLDGHLKNFDASLDDKFSINLIKGALNLHSQVASNFRKTAANFHYEFNIRHIANVFQGLLVAQPAQFTEHEKFVCLWIHESERVYGDRLVSGADLDKYNVIAQAAAKKAFPNVNVSRYYSKENSEALVFCHFAENMNDKLYNQIKSVDHMSKTLNDALHEYNETNATMDLVLFEDAMKHVARIVRIILNPSGHALLVGVGGSGKQSLTKLASFICTYTVFQIQISSTYSINDFKEDLKIMHNKAGVKEEGVTFLLTDSQITNERFLIYVNDLLASGDVPDLFAPDEVDTISNALVGRCKAAQIVPDKKNLWSFFINEIKNNLHVVLAFSPVGDDFRNRAKKFPALVNCTVIDWFQPWPKQALFAVGQKFMNEVEIKLPAVRAAIEKFLPFSFGVVQELAEKFKRVERRFVYMTPKSYLELLKLYGGLLSDKRHLQDLNIERLGNGLTKLNDTAAVVGKLQTDLAVMVEDAEKKKETAEGIAEVVSREKAIVEVETAKAQKEAEVVAIVEKKVSEKAADTKADLDKAEPAVEQAMAALDSLEKKDISNCKGMNVPPPGVGEVFGATMVLLANIVPSVPVGKTGKVKSKDFEWGPSKKILLGDIDKYIDNLKHVKTVVDESQFPLVNRQDIQQFLDMPTFDPEIIKTKNPAAGGLCSFVINIITYYDIVITVEPKRIALAAANKALQEAQDKLRAVNEHVANLEAKLAKLTAEFNAANAEKMAAVNAVENGNRKLDLAQRLIQALAAEGERWAITVDEMNSSRDLLTGDVLLASAFISYVGPFTKEFREELMGKHFTPFLLKEFTSAVGEGGVPPISPSADPVSILSNDAEIATWNSQSLPSDPVSSENGCIVTNSARWPLMIDPQLQGIRWIKNLEADPERELQIVRLDQKDMIRKMERALENGKTIMIENMGETMEAVLNPVIQRAAIKRGKKKYLKLGDTEVELHPEFKLFLHTKLSNPHYPPEIQAECTLVNFMVTFSGLEDQLLSLVVRKEQPDLAALGEKLIKQQNGYKIKMRELEDHILYKLATAEGDITEDVELIEGLEESKRVADEIGRKAAKAHETQTSISITSEKYRSVANRTSLLFFMMGDLVKIHTYYIYSLAAFTKVFFRGIDLVTSEEARSRQATAELERARLETEGDADDDLKKDGDGEGEGGGGEGMNKQASTMGEGDAGGEDDDDDGAGTGKLLSDEEMADRCKVLIDSITSTVFDYIRRGLFERHKLTVTAMLALRIATNDGWLDREQVGLLVDGKMVPNPGSMGMLEEWMLPIIYKRLKALEVSPEFKGLCDQLQEDYEEWGLWFMNGKAEECKMPSGFDKSLSDYAKLAFLRAIRPDRLPAALTKWLGQVMGKHFVEQPPFSMDKCFQETSNLTPVFFVLFPGVDPTPWVEKLALTLGLSIANGKFTNISMGQGQEKPAEALVQKFAKEGGWVMLQNLHLMQDWVPVLERLLEIVQENAHDLFRCFISAEPPAFDYFKNMPESLMQSCIKVANEAPADVKSNLKRAWDKFSQDRIDQSTKPTEFKGTLFALCWFHSIVCGRRRFGPQGWSRAYSFNDGDLTICAQVLFLYLETNPTVPWEDLRYIFGEIMYGGHITDPWDRVQSASYLQIYITEALFNGFELAPGFKAPDVADMSYNDVFDYVNDKLPSESPVLFGLHPNAEIGYLETMTGNIFNTILNIGGGGGAGGGNDVVKGVMDNLIEQLPESFIMVIVLETATPKLSGSHSPYVVVAMQECGRMNALLNEMRLSLTDLDKGLKGQLNMTDIMEDMITALSINEWPGRNPFSKCQWEKNAWPSKKGLQSQFLDLLERFRVIKAWSDTMDSPMSLWLPGLFNPTAYLTAIKQVTARATMKPLDNMTNETHFTTMYDCNEPKEYPEDGMFIHGLFMEGSRWSTLEESAEVGPPIKVGHTETFGHIMDSHLKELLPVMPLMYVKAVPVQPHWQAEGVGFLRNDPRIYECPVFITLNRGATYVFLATLNTNQPVTKWVLTGTALIMQTPN